MSRNRPIAVLPGPYSGIRKAADRQNRMVMDEFDTAQRGRHARMFQLLHQSERERRPAARAAKAAARYLDDSTADRIIADCVASLRPLPARGSDSPSAAGKRTLRWADRLPGRPAS